MRQYLRYLTIWGAREGGVKDYVEVKAEACRDVAGWTVERVMEMFQYADYISPLRLPCTAVRLHAHSLSWHALMIDVKTPSCSSHVEKVCRAMDMPAPLFSLTWWNSSSFSLVTDLRLPLLF